MRIAIIGAGMAGLACADGLQQGGHTVALFDKGRGPGGRMATRRLGTALGEVAFDHGAQYFTARDPGFCRQVAIWSKAKIVEPWPLVADDAWVGSPGMNAVIRHMAADHAVLWGHRVTGLIRHDRSWQLVDAAGQHGLFDAVVLAMPAEQAAAILALHDFTMARIALRARTQPCWTSMFVFDHPLPDLPTIIRSDGDMAWAARNSEKPGHSGPEAWVVQANSSWSGDRMDVAPDLISVALHVALSEATGKVIPAPVSAASHLWRYAMSAGTGDGALWNPTAGLGVCGDWLLGPRVEAAWISGQYLANSIIAETNETGEIATA